MSDCLKEIAAMHQAYVRGTGLQIALDMQRELVWGMVHQRGIRTADIVLVIEHMKRKAKAQQPVRSFTFRNLIGNVDYLEEDIAEAKAAARVKQPHANRASVLQATGREAAPVPPPSRSAGEIVGSTNFLAKLEEFKKQEGMK